MEDVYKMSSSELSGWKEYFDIYPTQGERLDWIINLLAVDIVKGTKIKPEELLPQYLKINQVKKSLEQQQQEALAWAAMYKAKMRN